MRCEEWKGCASAHGEWSLTSCAECRVELVTLQLLPLLAVSSPILLRIGFSTSADDIPTWYVTCDRRFQAQGRSVMRVVAIAHDPLFGRKQFAVHFVAWNIIEDTGFYWCVWLQHSFVYHGRGSLAAVARGVCVACCVHP